MKKNAMLKIAAVLLVAVLLTTCAISSTFAKYVSEGGYFTDSARVAKWGVVLTTSMNTSHNGAFALNYGTANSNKTVKSADSTNVVAPGTEGSFTFTWKVTGTPEVSCAVRVFDNDAMNDSKNYIVINDTRLQNVIKFTVKETADGATTTKVNNANYTAVNDYLAALNDTFDPTIDGDSIVTDKSVEISWVWAFDGDDDIDTALGNDDAVNDAECITINIYADVVQTGAAGAHV